jgi:hypothetical protein
MLKSELVIEEPVDVRPRWLRVAAVAKYYSIPRSRIYELLNEGAVRTAVLKKKGNQRGIRLICADSIETMLSQLADEVAAESPKKGAAPWEKKDAATNTKYSTRDSQSSDQTQAGTAMLPARSLTTEWYKCREPRAADRRKQLEALRQNVNRFITLAPANRYLYIVLTLARAVPESCIGGNLEELRRHVFPGLIEHFVRVTEYQSRGAPDFNFLVITVAVLSTDQGLRAVRRRLRKFARRYAFGSYAEIVRNLPAMPGYLTKMFQPDAPPHGLRGRRARLISYSRNWFKAATTRFSWNTPGGIIRRRKIASFALANRCRTWEEATEVLGPGWERRYRAAIRVQNPNLELAIG